MTSPLGLGRGNPSSGLTPSPYSSPLPASFGFMARSLEAPLWSATEAPDLHFSTPSGRPWSPRNGPGFSRSASWGAGGSRAGWAGVWVSFPYKRLLTFTRHLAVVITASSEGCQVPREGSRKAGGDGEYMWFLFYQQEPVFRSLGRTRSCHCTSKTLGFPRSCFPQVFFLKERISFLVPECFPRPAEIACLSF